MTTASAKERICGVLLAAGAGSRFHASTHKLLAGLRGRPVYQWSLDALLGASFDVIVVVTGAVELDLPAGVAVAGNVHWAEGQATSLQTGIAAARSAGCDAVVVGLGDQPFVTSAAWASVAADAHPIAIATYDGKRGNPVRLHRSVWELLPTEGDAGARSLFALHPDLVGEVVCEGSAADIDTMEDLQRWSS